MTTLLSIKLTGTKELEATLNRVVNFARRPRLAMREIAAVLEDETEKNFASQGRPKKWQDLEGSTKEKRIGGKKGRKKDGSLRTRSVLILDHLKILQDSGKLASSVHSGHGDNYAVVGAARPYAAIHQLGGKAGRSRGITIPARPYLPFAPDKKLQRGVDKKLLEVVRQHLQGAI